MRTVSTVPTELMERWDPRAHKVFRDLKARRGHKAHLAPMAPRVRQAPKALPATLWQGRIQLFTPLQAKSPVALTSQRCASL